MRDYDKLIVICSEQSLKAPPVIEEIERALQKEDDRMRASRPDDVLVPIRIDDYLFEWQHECKIRVTKKHVGDFRQWRDPSAYQIALKRLVHDLATEPAKA